MRIKVYVVKAKHKMLASLLLNEINSNSSQFVSYYLLGGGSLNRVETIIHSQESRTIDLGKESV